jgi:hypothetical protein
MISAEHAITRTRRDLVLGTAVKWTLLGTAVLAVLLQPILGPGSNAATALLFVVGAVWIVLTYRSMRSSRLAADSSSLIAAGQFDAAEQQIAQGVRSFSISRMVKLMNLHQLAMLRHAQNRWQESAALCRAVLRQKAAEQGEMGRSSRLMLAEALLELGDLHGTYQNLMKLYEQRLTLREALSLLGVQLDYMARVGAWQAMMSGLPQRVELAELLPTMPAAKAHSGCGVASSCWWMCRRCAPSGRCYGNCGEARSDMEVCGMLWKLSMMMGTTVAVSLVVVGLWGWGAAAALARGTAEPALALWAVRSGAVAALAAAQVLGMSCLVGLFYPRGRGSEMISLAAGFVCTVALLGAILLGWVSRG